MQEQDAKAASEGSSQSRRFTLHAGVSVDDMDDLLILILDVMVFSIIIITTMFHQLLYRCPPYLAVWYREHTRR